MLSLYCEGGERLKLSVCGVASSNWDCKFTSNFFIIRIYLVGYEQLSSGSLNIGNPTSIALLNINFI